ncbi:MAG TPA: glycoside hydrolase family 3 C-terminal domain-containing protein [Candidatus Angelobacter sp.]|nr:glycoside hydrolase family 3 C-terminal domain-containing protein [Candidatus Angelobacter sp.]
MGRNRKISSYFIIGSIGKRVALKFTPSPCNWKVPFVMRAGAARIAAIAAMAVLLALCGMAQPAPASPEQIERRLDSILSQMTIEEKIDLLGGVDGFYVRGVPRLGIPRFKMADGPLGVRNYGPATTMAGGIALAATWNPALAGQVGAEIGRDARAKGVHFLLGPGVNIYRAPMNGRNFEYFGEDPFLASRTAVGYIKGVQSQGVCATVKHFLGNNSEFDRHNVDSVIDERALREIYLPVFEAAVKEARVCAIMDSYNLVNGEHMTQNGRLNTDVAKKEWGFSGLVMSDWVSTYDAIAAANGGLDLEMPFGLYLNRDSLLPVIQQGKVSVATIDDKVRRILRVAMQFGWLDREQTDLTVPRYNQQGKEVALQAARESMVLLKNEGALLPLHKDKVKSIAVIGPDSYPAVPVGGGSAQVQPFASVSFLEGLGNYLGTAIPVYYSRGIPTLSEMAEATNFLTAAADGQPGLRVDYFESNDLEGAPLVSRVERHVDFGPGHSFPERTSSDRWTGYYLPQHPGLYDIFVESTGEDGGFYRLYVDGKLVFDNQKQTTAIMNSASLQLEATAHKFVLEHQGRSRWLGSKLKLGVIPHDGVVDQQAKLLAARADVVVVAVGFDPETESEGADRTFRLPPGQEQLIQEMQAANKNVVVVITSGGAVDMNSWLDRVPAVLQAWYSGQEGGTALAQILFGEVNPSGHLPVTFEKRWEDNPVHDSYYPQEGVKQVIYKEGVFVGYRGYEHSGKKPLFPFGHGLSYTTFAYSNLSVTPDAKGSGSPGGWSAEVAFDVTNTGKRSGAEVAQLYLADKHSRVERPLRELRGFAKVNLRVGEKRRVTLRLDKRALSYYDADSRQWRADPGEFELLVGSSSEDIRLRGRLTLSEAATR